MIETLLTIAVAAWAMLAEMAPYLLLGFLVAGVLSVVVSPQWVERHLGSGGLGQVFTASLFGVPLPLCSCGVIPVGASLRRHGAGKGATTAFLLSTPQTGVDSIAVTYALLGPFLAVFRPLAALVTGFIGGGLVHVLDDRTESTTPADPPAAAACTDDCCDTTRPTRLGAAGRALRYGFVTLPRDIGRALLVGIMLSGVIAGLVAPNSLEAFLGSGILPLLAAMVIGIPLYVCATASTPIALSLILAGLSPGAALVFLVTGPATNGATVTTLWKLLGRKAALIYMITVAACALGSGLLVDHLVDSGRVPFTLGIEAPPEAAVSAATGLHPRSQAVGEHHRHLLGADEVSAFGHISAAAIVLVLACALWPRHRPESAAGDTVTTGAAASGTTVTLKVAGMTCNGCVTSVTRALRECHGVSAVTVDLGSGIAVITGDMLVHDELHAAVTSLGFALQEETTEMHGVAR